MTAEPPGNRHEAAAFSLANGTAVEKSKAIRFIKNAIIGNRTNKERYLSLGVTERLLEILSSTDGEVPLKTEIAVVLCSLAHGREDHVRSLVSSGVVPPLFACLSSGDVKLVEAATKALRAIFQYPFVFKALPFVVEEQSIRTLLTLLIPTSSSSASLRIAELSAAILSKLALSHQEQNLIANCGALPPLLSLLEQEQYPRIQEAALDALAALCFGNFQVVAQIAGMKTSTGTDAISLILSVARSGIANLKLYACACLVHMYRSGALPPSYAAAIIVAVLPNLVKLFANTTPLYTASIQERSVRYFSLLVSDDEELQRAAMDSDAIQQLALLLNAGCPESVNGAVDDLYMVEIQNRSTLWEQTEESILLALAAVTSMREENRRQALDCKIMPKVLIALDSPSTKVRAAACQCTRSLSRSVKNLRTHLIDAGIAVPLLKLLTDTDLVVQTAACATICNMVLDFSPMKRTVIENGGIEALVTKVVYSTDTNLRLNALWALKNVLFQADSEIKMRVLVQLGFGVIKSLCNDPSFVIQEQALNLIRNTASGKEQDIDFVLQGLGPADLVDILEQKLCLIGIPDEIFLHALYILVNIATGSTQHKALIIESNTLLSNIMRLMEHGKPQIRIASIWILINLTWMDDPGAQERVAVLSSFGFEKALSRLVESEEQMEVRERVKTALVNFGVGGEETGDDAMLIEPAVVSSGTAPGGSRRRSEGLSFVSLYDRPSL